MILTETATQGSRANFYMLARTCICFVATLLAISLLARPTYAQQSNHYTRFKDATWYARQLQSLQAEVAQIDAAARAMVEARKSGKGVSGAVALDQQPEGVTSDGQMQVLQKRRVLLLRQIDALQEQARHNAIVPGDLRRESGTQEPTNNKHNARGAKDLEVALAEEKEHLDHARKEAELLRRNQTLKAQQEYSNPEPPSRRNRPLEVVEIGTRLVEKEAEVLDEEQRVANLEDQIEDVRRNTPIDSAPEADAHADGTMNDSETEHNDKGEGYRRKQFAAIDYKLKTAQTELDILQREHNTELVQYYPNPAAALKESVTRKEINEHREAIKDKKKEITELKKQRDDLEDELRHAGGPAGWARATF
jgi:hypothetical protein